MPDNPYESPQGPSNDPSPRKSSVSRVAGGAVVAIVVLVAVCIALFAVCAVVA
jgi:hypothetical protein